MGGNIASSVGEGLELTLQLDSVDAAPDGVDRLATELRRELVELDVDGVKMRRSADTPPGAKAIEGAIVGALVVKVAKSAGLRAVLSVIKAWVARDAGRTAKLEIDGDVIELSGMTVDDQQRLIDHWLDRHTQDLQ